MPFCYSYSRVSQSHQAGEDRDGLKRQRRSLDKWLKNNPEYILDDVIVDSGVSAYKGHNLKQDAGLGAFLQLIQEGKIQRGSALLIEELSRLTRRPAEESMHLIQGILANGVDIIILKTGKKYSGSLYKTLADFITVGVELFSNHADADERQRKVKEAWTEKRRKAADDGKPLSAMCPSWLKLKADRSGYDIISEKAQVVIDVFDMRLNKRMSMQQIAVDLNTRGVPVLHGRKYADGKGFRWSQSSIKTLLTSKSVIGTLEGSRYHADDPDKPGFYPAIVSRDVFDRCELLREPGKGIGKRDFPEAINIFKGLLYCPECQRAWMNNGLREKPFFRGSLTCRSFKAGFCTMPTSPYGAIEDALTQRLFSLLNVDDTDSKLNDEIRLLEDRVASLDKRISNLSKAIEDDGDDEDILRRKQLRADRTILKEEIVSKQRLLSATKRRTLAGLDLKTKEGRTEAQIVIRTVIDKVWINTHTQRADIELKNGSRVVNFNLKSDEDDSHILKVMSPEKGLDTGDKRLDLIYRKPDVVDLDEVEKYKKDNFNL
ncbi:recombinase family protein [Enterobacter mori]